MQRIRLMAALLVMVCHPCVAQKVTPPTVGALMSADEYRKAGLGKLSSEELDSLNAWLQRFEAAIRRASTASVELPRQGMTFTIQQLEGASIIANDGEPLGQITTNCYKAEALCNEYGKYGSEYQAKSILNAYGVYGGEYSAKSPFNSSTRTPPRIYLDGKMIAFLTANETLRPRVDPNWLVGILRSKK